MSSQDIAHSHGLNAGVVQFNTSVILVSPRDSKNVGAVARAMDNFGFSDLRLVTDQQIDLEAATVTACWARGVLDQVAHFNSLAGAVADCTDVVGFSSAYGKNRTSHVLLSEFANSVRSEPFPERLGLVFGPEDTGLLNEHVPLCRTLVRIASHSSNPSLNLAQAVLVALYELSRTEQRTSCPSGDTARWEEYSYLDQRIRSILKYSGFQNEGTPEQVPDVILGLFKRMRASKREMAMVQGMFKKIESKLTRNQ